MTKKQAGPQLTLLLKERWSGDEAEFVLSGGSAWFPRSLGEIGVPCALSEQQLLSKVPKVSSAI